MTEQDQVCPGCGVPWSEHKGIALTCAELFTLKAENERLKEERRWIPVSEKVPPMFERVWVAVDYGDQEASMVGIYSGRRWFGEDVEISADVTHWMPLPAAPSEKQPAQAGE